ncbi:enoyl-CoA hydratase/isomerase family protein [Jatrophihabitans sp. YIM 134969]
MPGDLRYERRGAAAWLVLDRPDKLNAITPAMVASMAEALDRVEADPAVRVVVLTGAGRAFCAGADLVAMSAALGEPDGLAAFESGFLHPLAATFSRLRTLSAPVVAAVNGVCAAGGLELVLCCDLVVAAQHATFTDAHARRGIAPAVGAAAALVDKVGAGRAARVLMLSETLPAATLADWGLVTEVVPAADLETTVDRLTETLASRSRASLAAVKRMLHRRHDAGWDEQVNADLAEFHRGWASPDMLEGVRSYAAGRDARFP